MKNCRLSFLVFFFSLYRRVCGNALTVIVVEPEPYRPCLNVGFCTNVDLILHTSM